MYAFIALLRLALVIRPAQWLAFAFCKRWYFVVLVAMIKRVKL
jgi:hypothetical protein